MIPAAQPSLWPARGRTPLPVHAAPPVDAASGLDGTAQASAGGDAVSALQTESHLAGGLSGRAASSTSCLGRSRRL